MFPEPSWPAFNPGPPAPDRGDPPLRMARGGTSHAVLQLRRASPIVFAQLPSSPAPDRMDTMRKSKMLLRCYMAEI